MRTVRGKPWTLCGSLAGLQKGVALVGSTLAQYVSILQSNFPHADFVGLGNICNDKPDIKSETVSLLGYDVPLNRPDPREWNAKSKVFEHSVDFGPGAPAPGAPAPAPGAPAPAPAPAPADSGQALVVGLAVGGAVLGLALLAGAVLLLKRSRGPRQSKEVPLAVVVTSA